MLVSYMTFVIVITTYTYFTILISPFLILGVFPIYNNLWGAVIKLISYLDNESSNFI